ncbi:hypothetical protein ACVWYF_004361 [Hymenobacter sp. UYAg731]
MPCFIIRIELEDVEKDHRVYKILHTRLENEDIFTKMYHPGNLKWYEMPHATYYTSVSYDANAGTVKDKVRRIMDMSFEEMRLLDKLSAVKGKALVTQIQQGGYPLATDYDML